MILRRFNLLCLLYNVLLKGYSVNGYPYLILSSTRSKCFSVIAPHQQTITIDYDAPDLQGPVETLASATKKNEPTEDEKAKYDNEGLDTQWNKRMKERLERIKTKKLRDTSITISQKGTSLGGLGGTENNQRSRYDADGLLVTSGTIRIREDLSDARGRIEFMTDDGGGTVEICIQSILASAKKPKRFHLRVDMKASDQEYDDGLSNDDNDIENVSNQTRRTATSMKDPEHLEHPEITTKMSRLERDLKTLQNRVKACLNNADYNKDQEALFHEQSISMNRATMYWPIIQLAVLIVTGFTQANHIVRYLKAHHIGI